MNRSTGSTLNRNLKIIEVKSEEELSRIQDEWNELLSQCENDSVFLRHEWFRIWWKNYGDNKKLFVLLVREEGILVGIAPLMRVTEKIGNIRLFPSRQIRFIENCEAPHIDFIIKEKRIDVLQFIFDYLESIRKQWDIIILENVPESSLILKKNLKNKFRSLLKFQIQQTRMNPVLQSNTDWESYFLTRSKRFRGAIRNRRNKIQKLDEITINKITNPQCIRSALQNVWEISRNSWKYRIKGAIASNESRKSFFSELAIVTAQKGWLNLWLLSKKNTPVAFEYHLQYKKKVYALRSEFNKKYGNFSPGFVLDTHIVEQILTNGVIEYDMGPSADMFKMRWTNIIRSHKVLFIFNSRNLSKLLYFIECKLLIHLSQLRLLTWLKKKRPK